jgi:hypothetical protein
VKRSSSFRAWTDLNSMLRTHKIINAAALFVCLVQMIIIGMLCFSDPIVVVTDRKLQSYHQGRNKTIPISEDAIIEFVKKFLKLRYEWKELDPIILKKNLAPVVTDGLGKKLIKLFGHLHKNEFQGKETSQSIVNIDVKVTKEKVIATFDKLLRIENIPIPVPTTVSLNIIKGSSTVWNPIGLLVNGIKEHQAK